MNVEIKKLSIDGIEDFKELLKVFKDVFEFDKEFPNDEHLGNLLSKQDFLVFVAIVNGQVIGGLTIYVLHQYYSERPSAYIYDVGISPAYQRKGVGKLLISSVCSYCEKSGFESAYVEAELEDEHAVNFYRKTKIVDELQAVHFNYSF